MTGEQTIGTDLATRRRTATPAHDAIRVGCVLLVLLGVVRSLFICLRRLPDADMSTVPLIAEAVRHVGLSALSAWHYTQDDWLLTVIIPELPFQLLLHPGAWLPALTGWLFFVGGCTLTVLLARPAIGCLPATLLGATLLFASPASMTGFGFLAHPTSHDVTAFWCLLGLLAIMACLRGGSMLLLLPAAAACLVAATISDPWAKAAFVLPISLVGLAATLMMRERLRLVAALTVLATLPCWLCGSDAFGLAPFLTHSHLNLGTVPAIPAHLRAGVLSIGMLFGLDNLLPGRAALRPADWPPSSSSVCSARSPSRCWRVGGAG